MSAKQKMFGELTPMVDKPFYDEPTNEELSELDRLMITTRIMSGEDYYTIARDFNITKGTVDAIKRKRKWYKYYRKHLLRAGYNHLASQVKGAKELNG